MFITVINDCQSQNDIARQETRLISLFNQPVTFVGVSSDFSVNATLEAAGTLIDVLDAAEDRQGIVILNVAPRGEQKADGHNGTAFGYFKYREVLVITTIRGQSLSLVKKLKLIKEIAVVELEAVCQAALSLGLLTPEIAAYIPTSQFRSYDFIPRLAYLIHQSTDLPYKNMSIAKIADVGDCVWYVDSFGNLKTTILASEIRVKPETIIQTNLGKMKFYARLKDIPKGETAMYAGSSGLMGNRFAEIGTQMKPGSAAKVLGVGVGQKIKIIYE